MDIPSSLIELLTQSRAPEDVKSIAASLTSVNSFRVLLDKCMALISGKHASLPLTNLYPLRDALFLFCCVIAPSVQIKDLSFNEVVYESGDVCRFAYVVLSGQVGDHVQPSFDTSNGAESSNYSNNAAANQDSPHDQSHEQLDVSVEAAPVQFNLRKLIDERNQRKLEMLESLVDQSPPATARSSVSSQPSSPRTASTPANPNLPLRLHPLRRSLNPAVSPRTHRSLHSPQHSPATTCNPSINQSNVLDTSQIARFRAVAPETIGTNQRVHAEVVSLKSMPRFDSMSSASTSSNLSNPTNRPVKLYPSMLLSLAGLHTAGDTFGALTEGELTRCVQFVLDHLLTGNAEHIPQFSPHQFHQIHAQHSSLLDSLNQPLSITHHTTTAICLSTHAQVLECSVDAIRIGLTVRVCFPTEFYHSRNIEATN